VEQSDEKLVGLIAAGDGEALRQLYGRHSDRVFRFALARLGDEEDARDAAQETWMAVWQAAGTYRGASSVSTWLFGICRNKVGEILRRRSRAPAPGFPTAPAWVASAGEAAAELWGCLGRMDEDDRELILLAFYLGLSQQEIAEVLGVPVGTVKSRTHYARRRLQELLDGGA
jgi:RNA polymerase sigma-70 factor (ECF subfamily)